MFYFWHYFWCVSVLKLLFGVFDFNKKQRYFYLPKSKINRYVCDRTWPWCCVTVSCYKWPTSWHSSCLLCLWANKQCTNGHNGPLQIDILWTYSMYSTDSIHFMGSMLQVTENIKIACRHANFSVILLFSFSWLFC